MAGRCDPCRHGAAMEWNGAGVLLRLDSVKAEVRAGSITKN